MTEEQRSLSERSEVALRLSENEARIADARKAVRRHSLFALCGLSPAAVLPILGLGADFGFEAAVLASVLVTGVESWRAVQAKADLREAEARRKELEERLAEPSQPGGPAG